MMCKKFMACTALFALIAGAAQADPMNMYVRAGAMGTQVRDAASESSAIGALGDLELNDGYGLNAALGYRFTPYIAAELEFVRQKSSNDNVGGISAPGSTKANAGLVNLMVDTRPGQMFSPYIGAGIGYANMSSNGLEDDGVFAYQAMAGLNINATKNTAVYVGYRYLATADQHYTDSTLGDVRVPYRSDSIEAGVKLSF